jgi:D-glucuronyl C5-epimerase C-terminus
VPRGGGVAWEYYFDFDGGRPPWVSGLAQGTALQALARASSRAGAYDLTAPILKAGLKIFETPPPVGVRIPAAHGIHYAQYSFAPGLRILNGFAQAVTGLYDYATLSGDAEAMQLFTEGESELAAEVPTYDTGAWSLYSRGTSTHESDLNYHDLLQTFLQNLCDRLRKPVYCDTAANFVRYTKEPPALQVLTRTLRRRHSGPLRFRVSKISRVTVTLQRGGRSVYSYTATMGYGIRSISVTPPKRTRSYDVRISATDLAGNTGSTEATVKVKK